MAKVVQFEIEIKGIKGVVNSVDSLNAAIQETNKELKGTEIGTKEYNKLQKQLGALKAIQSEVTDETKRQKTEFEKTARFAKGSIAGLNAELRNTKKAFSELSETEREGDVGKALLKRIRELDTELAQLRKTQKAQAEQTAKTAKETKFAAGSYRQLNAQLVQARREFKELSQTEREGDAGQQLLGTIQQLDKELKSLDTSIGQSQRKVGDYQTAFGGLKGGASEVAGIFGIGLGIDLVSDLSQQAVAELIELTTQFTRLRGTVEQLTGATGGELDEFTSRIAAIGLTFEQDNDRILEAANALSSQLNISFTDALTSIEKGFIAGADANGEFLSSLIEYSAQAEAAGLSTNELISVLNQSAKEGIFSDKGIDTIKEFGLRIREQTKPTRDALENAFGAEFTDELFLNLNKGATSTTDALKIVARELNNTELPANKLQTILADVFGGAGEDAGINFIKSLENIGDNLDDLEGAASDYAQRQAEILRLNQELTTAQNELTRELQGGTDGFAALSIQVETTVVDAFAKFVKNGKFVISGIVQLGSAIGKLIASIPGLGTVLKFVVGGLGELIEAFSNLRELAGRVSDTFAGVQAAATQLAENVTGRFRSLALSAEIAGKRIESALTLDSGKRAAIADEIRKLEAEQNAIAKTAGQSVGTAFNLGFENALRDRKTQEAATQAVQEAAAESEKIAKEQETKRKERERQAIQDSKDFQRERANEERKAADKIRKEREKEQRAIQKELDNELKSINKSLTNQVKEEESAAKAKEKARKDAIKAAEDARAQALQDEINDIRLLEAVELQFLRDLELTESEFADRRKILALETEKEILDAKIQFANDSATEQAVLQQQAADKELEINAEKNSQLLEQEQAAAEQRAQIFQASADIINTIQSTIAELQERQTETRLENLDDAQNEALTKEQTRLEQALELAGEDEERRTELQEQSNERQQSLELQFAAQREQIEREAFEKKKKRDIASILINSAVAASTTLSQLGLPAAIPALIALGVQTAAQLALVATQKFADGGMIRMGDTAVGRSHNGGGINTMIGGQPVQVEGGEFMDYDENGNVAVINKFNSGQFRNQLKSISGLSFNGKGAMMSNINAFGGRGIRFAQQGGLIPNITPIISAGAGQTIVRNIIVLGAEQIELISNAVRAGSEAGTFTGVTTAATDVNRENERQLRLNENIL